MLLEFADRAENAEADVQRFEMIADGRWPGAVALLEKWLETARAAGKAE